MPARTHVDAGNSSLRYALNGTWGLFYRNDDRELPIDSLPDLSADYTCTRLAVHPTDRARHLGPPARAAVQPPDAGVLALPFRLLPKAFEHYVPTLQSEGLFREASLWLNGQHLGT